MQDNAILLEIEPEPMKLNNDVEIMEEGRQNPKLASVMLNCKGVNAVIEERSGTVPLHLAILHSHIDAIKDVLEGGADVNARNKAGETALHIAVDAGQFETVKLLLKHRADVNAETNLNLTSLHIAVRKGNANLVKLLMLHSYSQYLDDITLSMNTNSSDHTGNTPLYDAVKSGNLEIVKMLLKADADPDIRNNDGDTPILLALRMGNEDLVLLLMKYGAKLMLRPCKEGYVLLEFSDFRELVLQIKCVQCLQRKNLVCVVRPSLHEIFHSKLPYELTCKIVDYMSDNDMRRYVELAFPKNRT